MPEPITIFRGATGLNTVADPVRIPFNAESALSDLGVAVNIEIDQSNRVSRRKGYEKQQTGNFHSLFCDTSECLVISGSSMYSVGTDYSLATVTTITGSIHMAYAQYGKSIYYNNPQNLGKITEGIYAAWEKGTYWGPDTNRQFFGPIKGTHIAILSGRMFISDGSTVWWSELYNFDLFDLANNHVSVDSDIIMLKSVDGGMYVSSKAQTYFFEGKNPAEWKSRAVTNYPAIEWSEAIHYVEGLEIGLQSPGLCAIWASPEGAILGTPTGMTLNLNKDKIIYPETPAKGAGCLVGYNYLHRMV